MLSGPGLGLWALPFFVELTVLFYIPMLWNKWRQYLNFMTGWTVALMPHVLESVREPDAVEQVGLSGAMQEACSVPSDRAWNCNITLL